jgi:hypothetical protein
MLPPDLYSGNSCNHRKTVFDDDVMVGVLIVSDPACIG